MPPVRPPTSAEYRPIQDYIIEPVSMAWEEMAELSAVWAELREALADQSAATAFMLRLRREWAIETGLIERVYTLDRGLMRLLVEHGVDTSLMSHPSIHALPRRVLDTIHDHETAFAELDEYTRSGEPLTPAVICQLHRVLMRSASEAKAMGPSGNMVTIPVRPGQYKTEPNNPVNPGRGISSFCPPEQVADELERLCELHAAHCAAGIPPEVEGAWLHHRFTQIHPFQDGNGRVARCLTTLVFLREGWFPLVVRDFQDERRNYMLALQEADAGDLRPLVGTFAVAQKRALFQALSISSEVLQREPTTPIEVDKVPSMPVATPAQRRRLTSVADRLYAQALSVIMQTARRLDDEAARRPGICRVSVHTGANGHPLPSGIEAPIHSYAERLAYQPNLQTYHAWIRLVLQSDRDAELLLSIHGVGPQFRGVFVASAMLWHPRAHPHAADTVRKDELTPLTGDLFQFNCREDAPQAAYRFAGWLHGSVKQGLVFWRSRLQGAATTSPR